MTLMLRRPGVLHENHRSAMNSNAAASPAAVRTWFHSVQLAEIIAPDRQRPPTVGRHLGERIVSRDVADARDPTTPTR